MVKIIYVTSSFPHKNGNQTGKLVGPFPFASIEAAKNALIPSDYEFAFISTEKGQHVYSKTFGWEFYEQQ
jgi:hypothetical protein